MLSTTENIDEFFFAPGATPMRVALAVVAVAIVTMTGAAAQVSFETPRAQMILDEDATWGSLIDRATGRECIRASDGGAIADIHVDGRTYQAEALQRTNTGLRLTFKGADTVLHYRVEPMDDWLLVRLSSVEGTRPQEVTLLRVPVAVNEHVGRHLNVGWDDRTAVCLMAANFQPLCRAHGGSHAVLTASTQDHPGPKLEGAAVALIVCPTEQFKPIARRLSHTFDMLPNEAGDGTPAKDTVLARQSYWFLSFGPHNVDKVIEYCHRAGVRQVMMGSGSWCRTVGHYTFKDRYAHGVDTLKAVVDRLHDNGILVGMHCFVSKVAKTDRYVTPVPDKRFWKDRSDSLAEDISAEQTVIRARGDLSQWAGSPVAHRELWEGGVRKHQECIIGDEIIKYDRIGPEGEWNRFVDCERGAWGTEAEAHAAGQTIWHFGVDGCINGYIIDQETSLMDEVADRIGAIFNHCGFDMVYFDGGEDVDRRRFYYYATNFQRQAMERFDKRPIIHMGTVFTHRLWHSFARSGTVDTYLNTLRGAIVAGRSIDEWPTVRDHIDRSVQRVRAMHDDMIRGELGWFGIWPEGDNTDGLQLGEMEYLMCKSLSLDAPVSFQTGFSAMDAHPLTPELLNIFRDYEQLRMNAGVGQQVREKLGRIGRDFAMVRDGDGRRFVEVQQLGQVGGTHDVRALCGEYPGGSVATIWHYKGKQGHVTLELEPDAVRLVTFGGEPIELEGRAGAAVIPFGAERNTIVAEGVGAAELRSALAEGDAWVRPPMLLFLDATDYVTLHGEMAKGADVGMDEPGALSDFVVCTGLQMRAEPKPWYAEYEIEIPHEGNWAIWARVRYPRAIDDSFGIVRPGEHVTLNLDQVLGNCGVNEGEWHWTGRGFGVKAVPPGRPITFTLDKGPFRFRVYAREGPGTIEDNPRLDLLCVTDDPAVVPTDEQAAKWLGE